MLSETMFIKMFNQHLIRSECSIVKRKKKKGQGIISILSVQSVLEHLTLFSISALGINIWSFLCILMIIFNFS